jgi:hypothetical protein
VDADLKLRPSDDVAVHPACAPYFIRRKDGDAIFLFLISARV